MAWAQEDVFSFVLYYKQRTWRSAQQGVGNWTRESLLTSCCATKGVIISRTTLHATQAQFEAAYPQAEQLRRVKRQFDPSGKFSNELWHRYL